jgi:hypothetical protein
MNNEILNDLMELKEELEAEFNNPMACKILVRLEKILFNNYFHHVQQKIFIEYPGESTTKRIK